MADLLALGRVPKPDPDGASPCPITLAAAIIQAYVQTNPVPPDILPRLVSAVGEALRALRDGPHPPAPTSLSHSVIARTVTTDHIISLEDGKPYRSLKRHLASRGLTEGQYRAKWGLPPDYPMVAPSFSAQRAQQIHDRTAAKRQAAKVKDETPKVKTTGRKARPAGAAHHTPVPA
jgi:predicted transcriptional regulator